MKVSIQSTECSMKCVCFPWTGAVAILPPLFLLVCVLLQCHLPSISLSLLSNVQYLPLFPHLCFQIFHSSLRLFASFPFAHIPRLVFPQLFLYLSPSPRLPVWLTICIFFPRLHYFCLPIPRGTNHCRIFSSILECLSNFGTWTNDCLEM